MASPWAAAPETEHETKQMLYDYGMEILREHSEEIMFRVMKSRSENKGNFAYLEDENIKREQKIAKTLTHIMWRFKLELDGKETEKGLCGWMCIDCWYKRYRFHSLRAPGHWNNESAEGWVCQEECEC